MSLVAVDNDQETWRHYQVWYDHAGAHSLAGITLHEPFRVLFVFKRTYLYLSIYTHIYIPLYFQVVLNGLLFLAALFAGDLYTASVSLLWAVGLWLWYRRIKPHIPFAEAVLQAALAAVKSNRAAVCSSLFIGIVSIGSTGPAMLHCFCCR